MTENNGKYEYYWVLPDPLTLGFGFPIRVSKTERPDNAEEILSSVQRWKKEYGIDEPTR